MNDTEREFKDEFKASTDRAFKEGHKVDNLVIELKTLRMSSNVSLDLVREYFALYLVGLLLPAASVKEIYEQLSSLLQVWGGVFEKLSPPFTPSDQVALVLTLQSHYATITDARTFLIWLRVLYETDLLETEAVVDWWKCDESREVGGENGKDLRTAAKTFVERLLEAESSDEDSEEGD